MLYCYNKWWSKRQFATIHICAMLEKHVSYFVVDCQNSIHQRWKHVFVYCITISSSFKQSRCTFLTNVSISCHKMERATSRAGLKINRCSSVNQSLYNSLLDFAFPKGFYKWSFIRDNSTNIVTGINKHLNDFSGVLFTDCDMLRIPMFIWTFFTSHALK